MHKFSNFSLDLCTISLTFLQSYVQGIIDRAKHIIQEEEEMLRVSVNHYK